jgi:hypothetical protein
MFKPQEYPAQENSFSERSSYRSIGVYWQKHDGLPLLQCNFSNCRGEEAGQSSLFLFVDWPSPIVKRVSPANTKFSAEVLSIIAMSHSTASADES